MDVIEAIYSRRSIRSFIEKPVEWDKVTQILGAGIQAPSAGNLQNYKFIVVADAGKREAIARAALQQLWIAQAPVIIVLASELKEYERFYGIRGERLYSIQDCAVVAENMLLAAHSLGLSACFVSAFDEAQLSAVVNIPDMARPQAIIAAGYSTEAPQPPRKKDLYTQIYLENFGNRLKDADAVLGNWSEVWRKKLLKAKEAAKKQIDKKRPAVQESIQKLKEKLKRKE